MPDIDTINISVQRSGVKPAADDIQKLSTNLKALKDVTESFKSSETNITSTFEAIGKALKPLEGLGEQAKNLKTLSSSISAISKASEKFDVSKITDGIDKIRQTVDSTSDDTVKKLQNLADAYSALRNVKGPSKNDGASGSPTPSANSSGLKDSSSGAGKAVGDINSVSKSVERLHRLFRDVEKVGKATFGGIKTAAKGAASGIKVVAGAPFKALKKALSSTASKVSSFIAMFKKRLLYRAINAVISAVSNGVREGIKNLYQFSKSINGSFAKSMDSAATHMLYFKNSIGAMVAPLVNMLVPVLERVVVRIVDFANNLNRLFAQISGASTWTQALMYPIQYAEAADDATSAVKKWKATVLGIDELNLMADNSDNDSGSSNSGMDYSQMFQEVELPEMDNSYLGSFFDPFVEAWNNKGQGVIDAWHTATDGIKHLFDSIGTSFATVWSNGTGQLTLETIFGILTNILLIIGNISEGFATAWDNDGTGTAIVQNIWNILNNILGLIEDITSSTAAWAEDVDWGPLLESLVGLTGAFDDLSTVLREDVSWAWDNIVLPIASWVIEEAGPLSIDTLTEALRLLKNLLDEAKPVFEWLWDKFLQPLGEWAGQTFIDAMTTIHDLLQKINDLLEGNTTFDEFIKGLSTWEAILLGIAVAVGLVTIAFLIYQGVMLLVNAVTAAFGVIMAIITSPITIVIAIIAALIAIGVLLYQNWETIAAWCKKVWEETLLPIFQGAWQVIKGIGQMILNMIFGIGNAIIAIVNGLIAAFEGLVNFFVGAINMIIKGLNSLKIDIPDWVPLVGGKTFGFNIQELAKVSFGRIPYLVAPNIMAEGGSVPNSGTMFVAGEAGPEIVANMGSHSGVMNVDQMEAAVREGIIEGSNTQNNLLQQILNYVMSLDSKDFSAEITTGDIRRALERANRRDGRTIIPVGT